MLIAVLPAEATVETLTARRHKRSPPASVSVPESNKRLLIPSIDNRTSIAISHHIGFLGVVVSLIPVSADIFSGISENVLDKGDNVYYKLPPLRTYLD